jgi:hypothetical protein
MGAWKADFDLNDGGEGYGNHIISTFPGRGMDVVRGSWPRDGEYAEVSEFVSVRESGRIRDGTAVSGMTSGHAWAL